MSEHRILYAPPPGAPRMIQATTNRKGDAPAKEGDIPAYFLWSDGSEYEVGVDGSHYRRYRGPLFGCDEWHTERWAEGRFDTG